MVKRKSTKAAVAGGPEPDLVDRMFSYLEEKFPAIKGWEDRGEAELALREFYGGDRHWVRSPRDIKKRELVRQVKSLFNGRNVHEVGRKLGISPNSVRRFVKEAGPAPAKLSLPLP